MKSLCKLGAITSLVFSCTAQAHIGGLNVFGCHLDILGLNYHCHSGPLDGLSFSTEASLILAFNEATNDPDPDTDPDTGTDPGAGTSTSASTGDEATSIPPFNRDDYLASWLDSDNNCMDSRNEILFIDSLITPTLDADGCQVLSGQWIDQFTGQTFTDPNELKVDHAVPLEEVHRSGGHAWDAATKSMYANDVVNSKVLSTISTASFNSRLALGPDEWMPENAAFHCDYVRNWVDVKHRYGLKMDAAETEAIEKVLGTDLVANLKAESLGWDEMTGKPSLSVFGLGVRKQGVCGSTRYALPSDHIEVSLSLTPDVAHIKQKFDIYVVADLPAGLFYVDATGRFVAFNGDITTLVPYRSDLYLTQSQDLSLFVGALNDEIVTDFYIGYGTESGDFVYTVSPIRFAVNY